MRQISAAQDLMSETLCSCMQRQQGLQSECNVIAAEQPAGRLYFGPEARVSTRKAALLIPCRFMTEHNPWAHSITLYSF